MLQSATTRELLRIDAADPVIRLERTALWEAVLAGEWPAERLIDVALAYYPTLGGTARYLFSSKVGTLKRDDGKAVFRELYEALTVPEADSDAGWRQLALALGATAAALDDALASPSPEAADYVVLARGFGHRSAHEGVGAAWGVERQLPVLWGRVADALAGHYEIPESALRFLRYQSTIAGEVDRRIMGLVERYLDDPWKTYEARRAARECVWAWKSIGEPLMSAHAAGASTPQPRRRRTHGDRNDG